MIEEEMDINVIQPKLQRWFEAQMPDADEVTLSSLCRPGAGTSNETFLAELQWRQGGKKFVDRLVLRWPSRGYKIFPAHAYDMVQQYKLLKCLGEAKIPVPPVRWLEKNSSVIGEPFYVVGRVDGWIPGDFPPYHIGGPFFESSDEDKAKIWWNIVDVIGDIHTLDWEKAGLDFLGVPRGGSDCIEREIAKYDEIFALNDEPMPDVLKSTRDWLLKNSFEPRHLSVCWGDARPGNIIISDNKVAAVLDWEMAVIGDPEEDLGWFVHMDWATSVGRPASPFSRMAGLPTIEKTIEHYEHYTGRKVENLKYHEVFATWRMAILFTRMEQDQTYLARSKNAKGFITWTHYEKLCEMIGLKK